MIRLWGKLIKPLVDLVEIKALLEIGSESGLSTRIIAQYMANRKGTLHAIDPFPGFEPSEVGAKFPNIVFHRDLSLNVLPKLPPFDVGLIDGDHNWYTVFNELRMIEARHQECGAPFPLLFIHDTGWPYGRRDMYYNPDNIPPEFRNPYAQKGLKLKTPELVEEGGYNADLYNAIELGGEKNGVMTGVEDFARQSSIPLKMVSLPIFHGLTILIPERLLDQNRKLNNAIEELLSGEGMMEVLALCEHIRCADAAALQPLVIKSKQKKESTSSE